MAQLNPIKLIARLRRMRKGGFTLIEVLVSIVISGIIVSGLLTLMVQMLKLDQEETVLNQTQQDIRRGLDYVTRELEQAVFVYPDQASLDRLTAELSDLPAGTPIMAFWRTEPIPPDAIEDLISDTNNCTTGSVDQEECGVAIMRQSIYTLVVYLLQDNLPGEIWEGPARIVRYELPQYENYSSLVERAGYADPTDVNASPNGFEGWESDGNTTNGIWAVLVDSVDDPADTSPRENTAGGSFPNCSDAQIGPGYQRIPDNSAVDKTSYSFFACVRDPEEVQDLDIDLGDNASVRDNQDLVVYLRGDATENRTGLFTTFSERSRLPTLESRVLVRGILNKRPQ